MMVKFRAKVKTDNGEWIDFDHIRAILLDKQGKPEVVIGPTGLQYTEFELELKKSARPYIDDSYYFEPEVKE